jgi:hypothetical protein
VRYQLWSPVSGLHESRNRTYTFNVFDVTLDFDNDLVRIDDILEADLSMSYAISAVAAALS